MIKSMTAFATFEKTVDELTISTEIRSYNSRYLDIVLRMHSGYPHLEDKIKELISKRLVRGRIEVRVQIEDSSDEASALEIDYPKANALVAALQELKGEFSLENDISLEMLVGTSGIVKPVEKLPNEESVWAAVKDCIRLVLDDLEAMRKKEGDYILNDFTRRLDTIKNCIKQIRKSSNGLLAQYQERLAERISVLTKGIVEIDPSRIAQEAAFLADRSDISEEIVRAESHLNQFRQIMNSAEPGGRKLNFLLQELNREFNTMGSKIGNAEVAHLIIDVKSELEKIREQVQNVE